MDNKMRVKNNGAVPTLLATLRKFPDNTEVVLSALKTLGNLVDLGNYLQTVCSSLCVAILRCVENFELYCECQDGSERMIVVMMVMMMMMMPMCM